MKAMMENELKPLNVRQAIANALRVLAQRIHPQHIYTVRAVDMTSAFPVHVDISTHGYPSTAYAALRELRRAQEWETHLAFDRGQKPKRVTIYYVTQTKL